MSERDFYSSIPLFEEFSRIVDPTAYRSVPDSWYVVLCDVRYSTKAVENGRYKDVNTLGACSIAAVRNALAPREVAFVFGGDGATFVVSEDALEGTLRALRGTRRMGQITFGLDLRVGAVPVVKLRQAGHEIEVAKYRLGTMALAMLRGGGPSAAEAWVKSAAPGSDFLIEDEGDADADFSGFQCRWDPIHSKKGQMVSLLVLSTGAPENVYTRVLQEIERQMGASESLSPVTVDRMTSRWPPFQARGEIEIHSLRANWMRRIGYRLRVFGGMAVFHLSRSLGIGLGSFRSSRYLETLAAQTDYRKFDDMLRMVIDCSPSEINAIIRFLDREMALGQLVYGMHLTDHALMTCLVHSSQDHLHFVDGANGGYTMAAKQLKERLNAFRSASAAPVV